MLLQTFFIDINNDNIVGHRERTAKNKKKVSQAIVQREKGLWQEKVGS